MKLIDYIFPSFKIGPTFTIDWELFHQMVKDGRVYVDGMLVTDPEMDISNNSHIVFMMPYSKRSEK